MIEIPLHRAVNTFVVRIWYEHSLATPRWRGRIEHLQSGRTLAFLELEQALAFIHALGMFASGQCGGTNDDPSEVQDSS